MLRDICENSVIRAKLTCILSMVRQLAYMRTTNLSRFRMISSGMFTCMEMTKRYVISGHASPVFHADFFPRLVKYDVTSQPVNA